MFPFEPCMQFESKTVAEPAGPVNVAIPCSAANRVRVSSSGEPVGGTWVTRDSR